MDKASRTLTLTSNERAVLHRAMFRGQHLLSVLSGKRALATGLIAVMWIVPGLLGKAVVLRDPLLARSIDRLLIENRLTALSQAAPDQP